MKLFPEGIDLQQSELRNPVIGNSSAPSNPKQGQVYFDIVDKHWKGWNGSAWVQVDNAALPANLVAWTTAPTTAADPGTAGEAAYDATHLYICVDTDTWVRVALATW